jgi:hypothetical protein
MASVFRVLEGFWELFGGIYGILRVFVRTNKNLGNDSLKSNFFCKKLEIG